MIAFMQITKWSLFCKSSHNACCDPTEVRQFRSANSICRTESLFLIAFADGTAALIDAMQFFHQDGSRERRALAAYSGTSGEVAFIKGLHAVGASAGSSSLGEIQALDRYDAGTGAIGVGARPSGITAVAFVPGRKAMAVTAGAEGKCCIVDFTQSTPERAVLLRSWHIRRPATSLSIICYARKPEGSQDVPHKATDEQLDAAFCIAIGREDGRVLLFSLDGTPLGEQVLDAKGAPIVAVEWARIGSSEDSGSRSRKKPGNAVEPRRQRLGNASRSHRHLHQKQQLDISPPSSLLTGVDNESPFDSSTPYRKPGISPVELASEEPAISTIHKLRTGVSRLGDRNSTADPVRHSQRASIDSLDRIPQGTSESTSSAYYAGLTSSCSPPAVPPRPIPRPGGKLSMRQAQTFSAGEPTAWSPYLVSTTSNLNEKRSGVVFDPQTSKTPITSNESISAVKLKDLSLSDVSAPLQPASKETTTASSQTSGSYKTASPQFQSSEASSDTVVDWSTALSRIPAPSLQHLHLVDTGHRPTKEETGSQVRSSPFSTLRGTSNSGSPTSSRTVASIAEEPAMNDTVVDWAAGLRRLPIIISNSKKQIDAVSTATESRQKGHISLSVSSTPRDTSTSVSYRTNEISNPAHQWPVFSFQEPIPAVRVIRASGDLNAQTNAKPKGPIRLSTPSTVSDTATTVSSSSQEPIVDWSSLRNPPNVGDLKRNKPSIKSHPSILMPVLANYTPLSPSPPKVSELLSRSTTPALPKPTSSVVSPTPEIHACACASIIESTLQSSLASLRAELAQQFEAQKTLFEELVRAGQVERVILAEENMLLRADLAKTERSKGEKRSPKAMRSWEEYKTGTPKAKIREV